MTATTITLNQKLRIVFMLWCICANTFIYAQSKASIRGYLQSETSHQPIAYANILLFSQTGSQPIRTALSSDSGIFDLGLISFGNYKLQVIVMGYKSYTKALIVDKLKADIGVVYLQDSMQQIQEAVITADRLKARSEKGKTIFYVTSRMLAISHSGTDVLKLIPGVQVDLMHNISLEGSNNILILVDGKERDKSFIGQLTPDQIEKIEVISIPPSNYEASYTGAINVVLKKDRNAGFSGQVNAEIPTSDAMIYIFPNYNISYGFKKFNFYTSYNGEISHFDIDENIKRKFRTEGNEAQITSDQFVKQRDWYHRFYYGFDYFMTDKDQFNFYAFYNQYSYQNNGYTQTIFANTTISDTTKAIKEGSDKNTSNFYSLYYKHIFEQGNYLCIDVSNNSQYSQNITSYVDMQSGSITNATHTAQFANSIKIDYSIKLNETVQFEMGAKGKFQSLHDKQNGFNYSNNVYAMYLQSICNFSRTMWNMGLRTEKSLSQMPGGYRYSLWSYLPYAIVRYKINDKQSLQFSYNRSINRPTIYQLNPMVSVSDRYSVTTGNSLLQPEFRNSITAEYSTQSGSNYISAKLFWNYYTNLMQNLTYRNDTNAFVSQTNNLGSMQHLGIQFTGTVRLGPVIFNPYLRLYEMYSKVNSLGKNYSVDNIKKSVFESGISSIVMFRHGISLSLMFQYNSPKYNIQGNTFCDPLYFIALEKTFVQKIKIGIVSGIPFTHQFVYQGSDIETSDFDSQYRGYIHVNRAFIWFRLSYQFNSGKARQNISREKEETVRAPHNGL